MKAIAFASMALSMEASMWLALIPAVLAQPVFDMDGPRRFEVAMEAADAGMSLRRALRVHYIRPADEAERTFLRYSNALRPARLARCVAQLRPLYDRLLAGLDELESSRPALQASFEAFTHVVPESEFPTVHLHVGCLNSGGTATRHGLHMGLEHYTRPADFDPESNSSWLDYALRPPEAFGPTVIHELMHFQQARNPETLLELALLEGGADYLAERFSEGLEPQNRAFGLAHEAEIWRAFRPERSRGPRTGRWFYVDAGEWPRDLGYFIGYRIAQAYVEQAADTDAAIRELLALEDAEALLRASGYAPASAD